MKFCMYNITTSIKIGGLETYYWESSRELLRQGHAVELIAGEGSFVKYPDMRLKMFGFVPRQKIFNLGNRFKKFAERVSFFINAYGYLKKQQYDVFLISKPMDFFACFFMKRINPAIKTVFVSGGEDFYGFDRYFARYVDFMVAVSNDNATRLTKRYNREVSVVPNGVDVDKFVADENIGQNERIRLGLENKKLLMSVGRVVGLKGFQLVIEALKELRDFHYVLIGDGEYMGALKELAAQNGVEDRVLFLGTIDNSELPKYLNMCDVYVQPTIGNEAFGITIIEAMACGLPVVASKNGGIVDIIENGRNGYLFAIKDVNAMAVCLQEAYANKESIGAVAKEHVWQNFTWRASVDKLLAVLRAQ